MASSYTTNLGIEKPATGEQSGTWGATTNTNFDILDQAIDGIISITLSSAGLLVPLIAYLLAMERYQMVEISL